MSNMVFRIRLITGTLNIQYFLNKDNFLPPPLLFLLPNVNKNKPNRLNMQFVSFGDNLLMKNLLDPSTWGALTHIDKQTTMS